MPLDILVGLAALFGHAALCVALINRVHAVGIPRRAIKLLTWMLLAWLALPPAVLAWRWLADGQNPVALLAPPVALVYFIPCWLVALAVLAYWTRRRFFRFDPQALSANHTVVIDVPAALGRRPVSGLVGRVVTRLPYNQALSLHVQTKELTIPRLHESLAGLSIAHLSDLHFTGRIDADYFQEVVRQSNLLDPDLVALTGDFVDHPRYIDWIPQTLSGLRSRHGAYFILGNHDLKARDIGRLRRALTDAGLVDLGGTCRTIEIDCQSVLLAGNELPWFPPAADPPPFVEGCPLRILLAHSPDQWRWARQRHFDLMLAGHTHGGQFCLPWIGPVLAPSLQGVEFAGGTFYKPPTLMHVLRGTSSELPLRWNCPPELAYLVLRK